MKAMFAVAVAMAVAGVVLGGESVNAQTPPGRTISVIAEGEASAPPDVAFLSAGVQEDGATPREALGGVNEQIGAVIAAARAAGIAERDIQTSGLSLFSIMASPMPGQRETGPPPVIGYRASNQITVVIRDLSRVESIIEMLLAAGITNLNGVQFGLSDSQALQRRALADAVEQARPLAEAAARAAGLTLGAILSIEEQASGGPPIAARQMATSFGGDASIAGGSLSVRMRVQVTFQVQG